MKRILFLLSISFLFLIPCFAQENTPCPKISVVTPEKSYQPSESISFSISPNEGLKNFKLEYLWKTSLGVVESGQTTTDVSVSTYGLENLEITTTVEIKGLPQNCQNIFSGTAIVRERPRPTDCFAFEKYDLSDPNEMMARIESLYRALSNVPTARGAIILMERRKESRGGKQLSKGLSN